MKTFNQLFLGIASMGVCVFYNSVLFAQSEIELNTQTETPNSEHAEHHELEEVLVSGVLGKAVKDTALQVNVLSDDELRENAASTIGETLQNQIGVNTASFGPGVGQPVIRGQSANRVQVLQNGTGALDVSNISQDHANAVEGLLATRIEVIRGPATLLYGNGAIGGVVNVIDNRIPSEVPEALNGAIEYRYNDVNNGSSAVVAIDGGTGNIAWHVDGISQNTHNVSIPGVANSVEPDAGSFGFIENSDIEKTNVTAGMSYVSESGFVGFSVNNLENNYGLPPEVLEAGAELIRLDMQQLRIDLKADYELDAWVENIRANVTMNDYTHKELEGVETGTVFDNQGLELRVNARHTPFTNGLAGSFGLQVVNRDFSALGEEAFIPASDISSFGIYAIESMDVGEFTYEGGLRLDRQKIDANLDCNNSETSTSASLSAIWNFSDTANVLISANRSQRAPSIEELYSNIQAITCDPSQLIPNPDSFVLHAATGRFELGSPSLTKETATNLEVAYRKHAGRTKAEISAFMNSVSDYIYLADVGEFQNTVISQYLQEDARFIGVEASLDTPIVQWTDEQFINLNLFADYVEAELRSGQYLPRIPPWRSGFELEYATQDWRFKVRETFVSAQEKTALSESSTDSYHRWDLYADYHLHLADKELMIFAKAGNVSNENIRNHTSFLKSFAPEAGRSVEIGIRYVH